MKKVTIFAAVLITSVILWSGTAAAASYNYENESVLLNAMGLYDGISSDHFDPGLGYLVNRETAVTLLVKMFGQKDAALALTDTQVGSALANYADAAQVTPWALKYVAYAVKTGMVQGDTATTLSPQKPVDGKSYATMILRNLGYDITSEGWQYALDTLREKGGLTSWEATFFNKSALMKDDIVGISYGSLSAGSPSGATLLEILVANGDVSKNTAIEAGLLDNALPAPIFASEEEEIVYNLIKFALINQKSQVDLSNYAVGRSMDSVSALIDRAVYETPRILYYKGGTLSSTGLIQFKYSVDAQTGLSHLAALDKRTDEILAAVSRNGMSDFEKELAAHDYIITHTRYSTENPQTGSHLPEAYNAYGVLVAGTGVCEGYAESVQILLSRMGVESMIVRGTSKNIGHAWNIVKIGGVHYQLDATWDDPVSGDGSDILIHDYFNITDSEMLRDHSWDRADYPPAPPSGITTTITST